MDFPRLPLNLPVLDVVYVTSVFGGGKIMQSLIDLPLLELAYDLHILLGDRIILEVIEVGGIVGEIKQIDPALVLFVELVYILLQVEIQTAFIHGYLPYFTIFSVSYFFDCEAVHLFIYYCFMCIAFSWILNFF